MVHDPFDLDDDVAYEAWRASKRLAYPAAVDDLRVSVARLGAPAPHETAALAARIRTYNMALVCTDPAPIEPAAILDFGRALGLHRTKSPPSPTRRPCVFRPTCKRDAPSGRRA